MCRSPCRRVPSRRSPPATPPPRSKWYFAARTLPTIFAAIVSLMDGPAQWRSIEERMAKRYQVIIIGGGPVGVGLAVNLGLRGISCALVELRAERLMPRPYPISGITAYGSLMSDYWFAPPQREIVRPYYFQDVERLPQYLTEKVLRARLADLPNVEAQFGWMAQSIEQDDKGVRVTVVEQGGSGREILEADYVVGCD